MPRLRWYKAEPRAFFDATRGWPNELKANYRLVLDLIYAHDGALPDDERWVAAEMGLSLRAWRRIKGSLIERGKLYVADGRVRNPRADRDVCSAIYRLESCVSAGEKSGEKRRKPEAEPSDFNGSGGTPVPTSLPTDAPTIKRETKKEKKDTPLSAPPKRVGTEKGCRLPDDFEPDMAEAERIGLSRSTALIEAEKFRDFWRGKPGKDGRKSDWPATWRNWCRNATEPRNSRHASPAGPTLRERMLAAAEEAVAAKEAREAAGRTLQ